MSIAIHLRPGFPLEPYCVQILNGDGQPIALTDDASLRLQVRESRNSSEVLVEIASSNGEIGIVNRSQGLIVLTMSAEDTAKVPRGGVFDLQLTIAGEVLPEILSGLIYANNPVTR